jgi:hypothetical protein
MFLASKGDFDDRTCTECGQNPSLGLGPIPNTAQAQYGKAEQREKLGVRKQKKNLFMPLLLLAWVIVIALILGIARLLFYQDSGEIKPSVIAAPKENELTAEDLIFKNEEEPRCSQVFGAFLSASSPEERNQYVINPVKTASRMALFYSLNPLTNIDPSTLSLAKSAPLKFSNGRALETVWNTPNSRQIDAVFIQEAGEWRIDWDHFVRFSDFPWSLFLAGSGEPTGEFRLLARERLAEERKNEDTISIVLYAPRPGTLMDIGQQSPEFLIPRASENGKLLEAALKLEREDKRPFGLQLASPNPNDLIRLRVKVNRVQKELERHFEIEKIIACHWYSIDEQGVEITNTTTQSEANPNPETQLAPPPNP